MRILVTGATGFVGRCLVPALIKRGHDVRAAMRGGSVFADAQEFLHGDLARGVDWTPALEGVDAVVHLAGLAHANDVLEDAAYERTNLDATTQLATSAARAGVQRFVFVSSIRAQTGPVASATLTEQTPPVPTDAYGRSKLAAERAVLSCGVPAVVFRPVLVCGPEAKGNLATLLRLAKLPLPLPLSSLRARRSLLSMENLISAIYLGLTADVCRGQTYVVADPEPLTIPAIVAAMRSGMHRRALLVRFPEPVLRAMVRLSLGSHAWSRIGGDLVVDPAKLIEHGWKPSTDTRRTLAELAR